ncbi:MAG: hypothetical protein JWR19_529, partial [Pedosphaera sp.]|nr:hypothetical protein [Pedosphaera sp.]
MTPITLEYAGTERLAADWGFGECEFHPVSKGVSTFTVRVPGGDPAAAAPIPFEAQIIIRVDRVFAAGAFSGGTILFKGRRTDNEGNADPQGRATQMVFSDVWYDLAHIVFQHYWSVRPVGSVANVNKYSSRIFLFQDISAGPATNWSYLTTDAQITEIINYAHTLCGAAVQIGTIDPVWNVPMYSVKAITCAEALLICLRTLPDCSTFMDYTTTPPTIHFRQRANKTAITLPYAGSDAHSRYHKSSRIKERPDLQVPQVVIQYQKSAAFDDLTYLDFPTDVWPGGATGNALRAMVIPIDIRGSILNTARGYITSAAFDPTTTAFWKSQKSELDRPEITGLAVVDTAVNDVTHPDGITIKDAAGATVSLATYPYLFQDGGVAGWMTLGGGGGAVVVKEVIISAKLKYTERRNEDPASKKFSTVTAHAHSARVKLTNSPPGTQYYSTIAHADPGGAIITGLAHNIYNSLATLRYEGSHT